MLRCFALLRFKRTNFETVSSAIQIDIYFFAPNKIQIYAKNQKQKQTKNWHAYYTYNLPGSVCMTLKHSILTAQRLDSRN